LRHTRNTLYRFRTLNFPMNLLFLSDIVGRPGREAVTRTLDGLKKEFAPDITIANAENIAHGKGVTESTIDELRKAGIDFFTSGNHVWKKEGKALLQRKDMPLIRPANYPPDVIGKGYAIRNVLSQKIAIINLIGRTFFRFHYDCPFRTADSILKEIAHEKCSAVFVDFHSEATSETRALGFYLDGRVSAVIGTHTHVQTADDQILPNGTAYITGAGMCGIHQSILGKNKDQVIEGFLKQDSVEADWDTNWAHCIIQGVNLKLGRDGTASSIERISKLVTNK